MKCPNCGTHYTANEILCPKCHTPLSNAEYNPVTSDKPKKRRRKKLLPIILILLVILIAGSLAGYQFYLSQVRKKCREATDQIFTCAKNMDFSSFSSSDLPEPLQSQPDVRKLVKEQLSSYLESSNLSSIIDVESIDTDALCDELTAEASYQITGVSADYHSCTVEVETENIDFTKLPESLYQQLESDLSNQDSSLWSSLKHAISSLFGTGQEQTQETDLTEQMDLSSYILEWYDNAKQSGSKQKTSGKIVYGIQDGKWTLLSFDQDLIYGFYGLSGLNQ